MPIIITKRIPIKVPYRINKIGSSPNNFFTLFE